MRWTLVSLALDECLKCPTVHRVASVALQCRATAPSTSSSCIECACSSYCGTEVGYSPAVG